MKFAVFYEIPVPRPWSKFSERDAFQNTLEQAVFAEKMGFHAFWTVEHHFLSEFSHCSNPEVLYGAVAARTKHMRLGYGVRLIPRPYNHPVRSAESAAVLDLVSNGRVDFATGRSVTRLELEGFGIDPRESKAMWREGVEHIVGCWTHDEYEFDGRFWSMPRRRVVPKPLQEPHPPLYGATGTEAGHQMMGELGLGLCSFSVGLPPEDLKKRIDFYKQGLRSCTKPLGAFVNDRVAAFTAVNCAPTQKEADQNSKDSFEWYLDVGTRYAADLAVWMRERDGSLGDYSYLEDPSMYIEKNLQGHEEGRGALSYEELRDSHAMIAGDPERVVAAARAYEAAGVDLLLCLVNPCRIPHEKVMQTIELMGKHVIPEFE